jgi:hypothetical protein
MHEIKVLSTIFSADMYVTPNLIESPLSGPEDDVYWQASGGNTSCVQLAHSAQ